MKKPIAVPGSRFTCEAKPATREADIHVYGTIGVDWWGEGVDPAQFVKAVDALDVDTLRVWVNSPGGDAFGGLAMLNALRRQKAHVVVTVDGLAASAASYLALGGDELVMGRQSQMMIHDASGMCYGNASDMADMVETLDKISDSIAEAYAEKAGGAVSTWRDLMRAETWLSAAEAVEKGLADRVDEKATNKAQAAWRGFFAHAEAPMPAPESAAPEPPASEPGTNENPHIEREDVMSDTLIKGLRDRLGVPADAELTEDGILAALDEALTERAAEAAPTPVIPEGTALIDAAQLAELRDAAAAGVAARNEQITARRAALVENAIAEGRIPPARRDHWLAQLAADEEGASAVLASLEPNTIPVSPVGYTGGVEESSDDDLYAKAWGNRAESKEA